MVERVIGWGCEREKTLPHYKVNGALGNSTLHGRDRSSIAASNNINWRAVLGLADGACDSDFKHSPLKQHQLESCPALGWLSV